MHTEKTKQNKPIYLTIPPPPPPKIRKVELVQIFRDFGIDKDIPQFTAVWAWWLAEHPDLLAKECFEERERLSGNKFTVPWEGENLMAQENPDQGKLRKALIRKLSVDNSQVKPWLAFSTPKYFTQTILHLFFNDQAARIELTPDRSPHTDSYEIDFAKTKENRIAKEAKELEDTLLEKARDEVFEEITALKDVLRAAEDAKSTLEDDYADLLAENKRLRNQNEEITKADLKAKGIMALGSKEMVTFKDPAKLLVSTDTGGILGAILHKIKPLGATPLETVKVLYHDGILVHFEAPSFFFKTLELEGITSKETEKLIQDNLKVRR